MQRRARLAGLCLVSAILSAGAAWAQGRGAGGNWPTAGNDPQRTSWVRTDAKISKEAMQKPGFQLLWQAKLDNQPRELHSLTQPLLLQNIISYKGFKALAFIGGSADNVYAIDYDLNRPFWKTHLSSGVTTAGTAACPAALTSITRATQAGAAAVGRGAAPGPPAPGPAAPAAPGASAAGAAPGGARGGSPSTLPPGAGAPAPTPPGAAAGQPATPPPAAPGGPPPGGRGRGGSPVAAGNNNVFAISSGGMVHVLNVQTGEDLVPPIKFLPAGARVVGSVLAGTTLYAATTGNCGGAPNGVHALDLSGESKTITTWDAKGAMIAGSVAPTIGTDGTVYAATGSGTSDHANSVVALEPAGLKVKDWFSAGASPFVSAPVVFQMDGKDVIAAVNQDGRLYVLSSASLGGADHKTPLARSPQFAPAGGLSPGAVTTWLDASGTRWIAVPSGAAPSPAAKFAATNGSVSTGAILTFKVAGPATALTLEPGWVSRDLTSPLTPLVMNGVMFALAGGGATGTARTPAAQRARESKPAVLYALDADTGKELWSSGTSITSPVFGVGPSGGDSQVYVVTHDATVFAFGVPMER
jgi:outer membrane protein assembly factor BamB